MRNAPEVHALGPPADTGLALLDYMCRRVGLPSLEGLDVLDFGCGTRFADTIMDRHVPLRSYVGIDVNEPMVRLATHATDPRLEFHLLDARNPKYNPNGQPLTAAATLPVDGRAFDEICMFSMITHQQPDHEFVRLRAGGLAASGSTAPGRRAGLRFGPRTKGRGSLSAAVSLLEERMRGRRRVIAA